MSFWRVMLRVMTRFAGDPAPSTTTTAHSEENPSVIEQVKLGVASVAKSFSIDMYEVFTVKLNRLRADSKCCDPGG